MMHNTFTVSDIIENANFDFESRFVIHYLNSNGSGEITRSFVSWEDTWGSKNMEDADAKEVVYMTIVSGYGTSAHQPVLIMEVMED